MEGGTCRPDSMDHNTVKPVVREHPWESEKVVPGERGVPSTGMIDDMLSDAAHFASHCLHHRSNRDCVSSSDNIL